MDKEALISVANIVGFSDELIQSGTSDLFFELSAYLNDLVNKDFNRLVFILYRVDVSEQKVRTALSTTSDDTSAGEIITRLLIEGEKEKIEWRRRFKNGEL